MLWPLRCWPLLHFLSLLQMAEEFGSLTGEQVVDRRSGLLPGRPRVMGKRLLNMAADLELLEGGHSGRFNLTEYGSETLENETVFVPEEASWTIWVTEDPLFPTTILHVERHREGRSDRDRRGVQPLPSVVSHHELEHRLDQSYRQFPSSGEGNQTQGTCV